MRLHITHLWAAAGGSLSADIERDGIPTPASRTLLTGPGTLSGTDVWVPAGGDVDITGTAGFHGWLEPAVP